jgi:hypothetical protein
VVGSRKKGKYALTGLEDSPPFPEDREREEKSGVA